MPGKIPKPEERNLDETGFNFVKRCIEVLESRGVYEVAAFLCYVTGTVNVVKLHCIFKYVYSAKSLGVALKN
jgi:hypothetical protein